MLQNMDRDEKLHRFPLQRNGIQRDASEFGPSHISRTLFGRVGYVPAMVTPKRRKRRKGNEAKIEDAKMKSNKRKRKW